MQFLAVLSKNARKTPMFWVYLVSDFRIVLRHDSDNKVKHSWKFSYAFAVNWTRVARYKTIAPTTEPKSRLSDAVVRDWLYTRSYAKSTLCRYIGESAWPVTLPLFKEVIIYDDGKPF